MSKNAEPAPLRFRAVIFDMDGVVTNTAKLHAVAWKELFDSYLRKRAQRDKEPFVAFDARTDYLSYVDGKPRYDGVRSFLESRGIELPYGTPSDGADAETVCAFGNTKDELFERLLHEKGPEVFETTIALINALKERGVAVAIVSSSKHCHDVLRMAGIEALFEARVDGVISETLGLKGKPEPDIFSKAAELLGTANRDSVIVEDAISGVQAGRNGGFGLVIGVDRGHNRVALEANGADIVLRDLAEIGVSDIDAYFRASALPSALDRREEIAARLCGPRAVVFLDYDGTLTPIVARPELAVMSDDMRATVRGLAAVCPTAIVSGRALSNVMALVQLDELYYAGNHGFEIASPDDSTVLYEKGKEFLAAVKDACQRIEQGITGIDGAFVENKTYSLSVHYRLAAAERVAEIERVVDDVLKDFPNLQKRDGKKVFEVRPKMDWDKGKAVLWLLQVLHLDGPEVLPIYVGDDSTDEDAFRALKGRGLGVLVSDTVRESAADYSLRDTGQTKQFLEMLTTIMQEARS